MALAAPAAPLWAGSRGRGFNHRPGPAPRGAPAPPPPPTRPGLTPHGAQRVREVKALHGRQRSQVVGRALRIGEAVVILGRLQAQPVVNLQHHHRAAGTRGKDRQVPWGTCCKPGTEPHPRGSEESSPLTMLPGPTCPQSSIQPTTPRNQSCCGHQRPLGHESSGHCFHVSTSSGCCWRTPRSAASNS